MFFDHLQVKGGTIRSLLCKVEGYGPNVCNTYLKNIYEKEPVQELSGPVQEDESILGNEISILLEHPGFYQWNLAKSYTLDNSDFLV